MLHFLFSKVKTSFPGCSSDANCFPGLFCVGDHLCQAADIGAVVVDLIVKTKNCSGCLEGNVEQGLVVHLIGLLGLNQCTTDNLDNLDAHDYSSGSVAHFGRYSGLGGCEVSQLKQMFSLLDLPSFRLTSTNRWRVEALLGRDLARGPLRARTQSALTSMGPTTTTAAVILDRHWQKKMDLNLSQTAIVSLCSIKIGFAS